QPWVTDLLGPLQRDYLRVGDRLPVHAAVLALQREGVGINAGEHKRRRPLLAVGEDGGRLDDPLVAVAGPGSLTDSAAGVEDPRADGLRHRVPAYHLLGVGHGNAAEGLGQRAGDEAMALGPGEGEPLALALARVLGPVAEHRLQVAQVFVIAGGR